MFPDLKTPLSHALVVYPLDASFPLSLFLLLLGMNIIFTFLLQRHYIIEIIMP